MPQELTMNSAVDLCRQVLWVTLLLAMPLLLVGLAVGVFISILQAATQVQEQTLAFIPKILAVVAALIVAMPWMLRQIVEYTRRIIDQMIRFV
jgi:flagellar biosynthetic protein FliQ